jgi:hypothetical protein
MLKLRFVDSKTDNDNYVCHFNIDDTYDFELMVPKYMPEILEEDDEGNPFYMNFLTTQHHE